MAIVLSVKVLVVFMLSYVLNVESTAVLNCLINYAAMYGNQEMITTYNDQPCFNANEIMNTLYLNAFVFERDWRVVNQRLVVDCNRVRKRRQSYVGEFGGGGTGGYSGTGSSCLKGERGLVGTLIGAIGRLANKIGPYHVCHTRGQINADLSLRIEAFAGLKNPARDLAGQVLKSRWLWRRV